METVSDLVRYYPYRTRQRELRDLRQKLLPRVEDYIVENGPLYSPGTTEAHVLAAAGTAPSPELLELWRGIELRARARFSQSSRDDQDLLLAFIARGQTLFVPNPIVDTGTPMLPMLPRARAILGGDSEDLDRLRELAWPPARIATASLKGAIYAAVDFTSSRQSYLKPQFVKWLVSVAPGETAPFRSQPLPSPFLDWLEGVDVGLLGRTLLRRDVLGQFDFLAV